MARITLDRLEKYLWGSADLLRGHIDAGDYKQFIFPLLFFKRICDVWDEEYQESINQYGEDYEDQHRFIISVGNHWSDVRANTKDVGKALKNAMKAIEDANKNKLGGIFGDAQWTNKDRLPDKLLLDLMEHFSKERLTLENVPDDELGNAYEYLIRKFADDSGHTAQEFYSNRTLIKLMAELLEAKPGESIYDPTCGTGGMLLITATHLKEKGEEYRSLKLYGQEINLITSSISRMNMFLHGIEDFDIVRGDTLKKPAFFEDSKIKKFDIVVANPPYSIKNWDRDGWVNDPYGRNIWGTPPQGCADYAFLQHIVESMDDKTGRAAILFPHGVLFRDSEQKMRRNMVESDIVECVLGLGANLFYNSPMEACVLILNKNKPQDRRGKIQFINAVNEVRKEKIISYIDPEHRKRIEDAFFNYKDINEFSKCCTNDEVLNNNSNLNIALYVSSQREREDIKLDEIAVQWKEKNIKSKKYFQELLNSIKGVV